MEGTRIVLVRHGESRAQELGFLGGHASCKGLSDRGRRQADALRQRLSSTGELRDATVLYASVLPRAIETAQLIAPALGGLEVREECDFCEGHPGEADGLTWEELAERYDRPTGGWDPNHRVAPGWETWQEMGERVQRGLAMLLERHPGETVVVACHGGVVVQAMVHWMGLEVEQRARRAWLDAENTSITEWRIAPNPYSSDALPVRLVRFNDHAHLGPGPLTGA